MLVLVLLLLMVLLLLLLLLVLLLVARYELIAAITVQRVAVMLLVHLKVVTVAVVLVELNIEMV